MNTAEVEFVTFPKMARLSRECIITEKIDGTNAQICITGDGQMLVGSRTRWITPENDNYGFAAWAYDHRYELMTLGPGRHFGEWWGQGIQRKYEMPLRLLSLFNTQRWCLAGATPKQIPTADPRIVKMQQVLPSCVGLVPVLYQGEFKTETCFEVLESLKQLGSVAAPGYPYPEGIVCYHVAAGISFKKAIEKDETPKALGGSV